MDLAAGRRRPGRGRDGLGRLGIVEHCRFVEENLAVSRVFFRKKVNFHVLTELPGLVRHMVPRWRAGAADAVAPDAARVPGNPPGPALRPCAGFYAGQLPT
jgi:hypothetical protein